MPHVQVEQRNAPGDVERILRGLPDWFGIEGAIQSYVADAARLPSYLGLLDGQAVGICLVRRHFAQAAEIHLLAVEGRAHGRGVGSALVGAVETDLRSDGVTHLLVHTVGPSSDSEPYAATRRFYQARGFVPLQELRGIDWDGPTLIMVKNLMRLRA